MRRSTAIKEVSIQDAKEHFEDLIADVEREGSEYRLQQEGKTVARLTPSGDVREARERFFARSNELRRSFQDVPDRELQQKIDEAVAQVRGKRRQIRSGA
jgi:prevent-host-death family protein